MTPYPRQTLWAADLALLATPFVFADLPMTSSHYRHQIDSAASDFLGVTSGHCLLVDGDLGVMNPGGLGLWGPSSLGQL
jgi:hypothetical protein